VRGVKAARSSAKSSDHSAGRRARGGRSVHIEDGESLEAAITTGTATKDWRHARDVATLRAQPLERHVTDFQPAALFAFRFGCAQTPQLTLLLAAVCSRLSILQTQGNIHAGTACHQHLGAVDVEGCTGRDSAEREASVTHSKVVGRHMTAGDSASLVRGTFHSAAETQHLRARRPSHCPFTQAQAQAALAQQPSTVR